MDGRIINLIATADGPGVVILFYFTLEKRILKIMIGFNRFVKRRLIVKHSKVFGIKIVTSYNFIFTSQNNWKAGALINFLIMIGYSWGFSHHLWLRNFVRLILRGEHF